ncbi:MAG: hypothetical protein M3004_03905 [Bacteroidota bacterium]|nr:hypothetical protein [Bacteroidota bacterium]
MRSKELWAVIFITFLLSCNNQKTSTPNHQQRDSLENHTFFPVTEYLLGQLKEIDSLPITPLKIITLNGKSDSLWMKKEDIRIFAQPFLHPEIDTTNFKKIFRERSFLDQTIDAVTFSYDPIDKLPDSLPLKRWDVYIDPQKNSIKRIYLVKETFTNGLRQTFQLTWKPNQWCKITTITEQAGKQPLIKEETMKWNFSE